MTREEAQPAWKKIVDTGFSNYNLLTKDQKVWFNIEPLTTDGIIDHYINHGAEHNLDTTDALTFLGYNDIAELMRKINTFFTNGLAPADINERNDQWNSWCDEQEPLLNEVDEKFWARCNDLDKSLMEHINSTKIGIA